MSDQRESHIALTDARTWLVPVLAFAAGLALFAAGRNQAVFLWLNALGFPLGDTFWSIATVLGDTVVALALCLLLARRRPDLFWAAVPVALIASIWVQVSKPLIDVLRPPAVLNSDAFHVIGPAYHYHSFPSGHTTTAFALAGVCMLGFRLGFWNVAVLILAVLVGVSRCVVGVHWPLDVLAGAGAGWVSAVLGLRLASRLSFGTSAIAQWLITAAFGGCAVALLVGHDTRYPEAIWFQRAIGVVCLMAFAWTFIPRRSGRAASG